MGKMLRRGGKTFLFPALMTLGMLAAVYTAGGLFPFGRNTLAWGDMTQQALPFMVQFKNMAAGRDGLLFSMGNAAGMNFWGVLLFFIASPFTLLGLLVPRADFMLFANVLVLLKMMLAACAATAYFRGRHSLFRLDRLQAGALGVLYAFGGYALMYYQNIVWLDQLILFPLLMMALDRLLQGKSFVPYALLLAASIFCQYQISFTVVLVVVFSSGLYVLLYAGPEKGGGAALRLGLGTLLGALLSAVVWLPALLQLRHSARGLAVGGTGVSREFFTHVPTTLPMVLCTSLVLAALLFLLRKKRMLAPRVLYALTCFSLFVIPLLVEPVNKMWHGGSYQAFPARYGFATLLFGLMLAAACLAELAQKPAPVRTPPDGWAVAIGAFLVLAVCLGCILLFRRNEANYYVRSLWGSRASLQWALVACFVGGLAYTLLLFARSRGLLAKKVFLVLLCCFVAAEGMYNGVLYIASPARGDSNYRQVMDLAGRMSQQNSRVKQSRKYTDANNLGAMGYASISHYSSLTRTSYITAAKKLGYSGYWMEMSGLGGTAISDYFLNVGGVVCQNDDIDPAFSAERTLYANPAYALVAVPQAPGGYGTLVAAAPEALAALPEGDRFAVQDWLYTTLYGGQGPLCRRYEPQETPGAYLFYDSVAGEYVALNEGRSVGRLLYSIEVGEREDLYFDCFHSISSNLHEPVNEGFMVLVNGVRIEQYYPHQSSNGLLYLGSFENETVDVELQLLHDQRMRSFGVCGVRRQDVARAAGGARHADVQVKGSRITAQAAAQPGDLLLLSIGYDEGFTATVNGQAAPVYRALDGFMAVPLQAGENEVALRFVPEGFRAGVLLSAAGLGVLLACVLWRRRRGAADAAPGRALARVRTASALLLGLVFFVALFSIYLIPVVRTLWARWFG